MEQKSSIALDAVVSNLNECVLGDLVDIIDIIYNENGTDEDVRCLINSLNKQQHITKVLRCIARDDLLIKVIKIYKGHEDYHYILRYFSASRWNSYRCENFLKSVRCIIDEEGIPLEDPDEEPTENKN
jgi:hypothetical protein